MKAETRKETKIKNQTKLGEIKSENQKERNKRLENRERNKKRRRIHLTELEHWGNRNGIDGEEARTHKSYVEINLG